MAFPGLPVGAGGAALIENKVYKRNTFSIVVSNGVKYAHWMKNAGLKSVDLPAFFLIDFVVVSWRANL